MLFNENTTRTKWGNELVSQIALFLNYSARLLFPHVLRYNQIYNEAGIFHSSLKLGCQKKASFMHFRLETGECKNGKVHYSYEVSIHVAWVSYRLKIDTHMEEGKLIYSSSSILDCFLLLMIYLNLIPVD